MLVIKQCFCSLVLQQSQKISFKYDPKALSVPPYPGDAFDHFFLSCSKDIVDPKLFCAYSLVMVY